MYIQNCIISANPNPSGEKDTIIEGKCIVSQETVVIKANLKDIKSWINGKLIQEAMPYLTPGEREFLISGFSEKSFDKLFSDK